MKHWSRAFGKFVVPVVIVLCGSFGGALAADKDAKAPADPKPAATEIARKFAFQNPANAFDQYKTGIENPAVQAAAKDYLQQIVDQSPRDPVNFSTACASLVT